MTDSKKQTTQPEKQIAQAEERAVEAEKRAVQVGKHNAQSEQNEAEKSSIDGTTIQISPEQAAPSVGTGKSQGFFRGLFDDLSMAQVIAGALAAATVFLLSSVIGVAGSLIGAAIGSVISAVSSQVYKKALSASADKLRDASSTTLLSGSDDISGEVATGKKAQVGEGGGQSLTSPMETSVISDATRVMNANDIRYASSYNQGEDPALKRAHARRGRKAKVQRQVLIVSVVSSLVAIVICACVITFATQGEGIGTKPIQFCFQLPAKATHHIPAVLLILPIRKQKEVLPPLIRLRIMRLLLMMKQRRVLEARTIRVRQAIQTQREVRIIREPLEGRMPLAARALVPNRERGRAARIAARQAVAQIRALDLRVRGQGQAQGRGLRTRVQGIRTQALRATKA